MNGRRHASSLRPGKRDSPIIVDTKIGTVPRRPLGPELFEVHQAGGDLLVVGYDASLAVAGEFMLQV